MSNYIKIEDLEVYKLARQLSSIAWEVYQSLNWKDQKVIGDQYLTSTDSVGANIAEGYGRFHYLDRIRFLYNARGSLFESIHWIKLLIERDKISAIQYESFVNISNKLPRLKKPRFSFS